MKMMPVHAAGESPTTNVTIDFGKTIGKVKPMHAVNNGPSCTLDGSGMGWDSHARDQTKIRNGNLAEFRAAGIPYARTHDASFYPTYGLEHTVDVHAIFPDFDADPYSPDSYDFVCTDHYLDMIEAGGAKVFYRLGSRIEHEIKKYGTVMPKDFQKWAVICEHIIRHCTEGWANGSYRDIEYWEIWNEPDLDADDAENKRCWSGTKAQFFEFYHVAATHLKKCFPHLKIGGPGLSHDIQWTEDFLSQLKAPLDFFSWHVYPYDTKKTAKRASTVRHLLDKYGFEKSESILSEWNYVHDWAGDDMAYSLIQQKKIKGAAFNLATMFTCQHGSVDMLMYYDARPCAWNGMFDFVQIGKVITKAYYSFPMFDALYRLGRSTYCHSDNESVYVCAATDSKEAAFIVTHFDNDDSNKGTQISVDLKGLPCENGTEIEVYLLDGDHDLTLMDSIICYGDKIVLKRLLPNYTSYLVKINPCYK